ncbi:MAG: hypothetical protein J7484_03405 [Microbacterium sp.]|nr:hypothetical protein [Microbacterium sp.]
MDTQNTDTTDTPRPFGFWITAVDRLMAAEFASAFEREGASRRDWRLLNVIDGTAPAHRPFRPRMLHDLVERGWASRDGDDWALTEEGRAAKERLATLVDGIRATMTDAVSPEEYETTVATLEKIATALGWEEGTPLPRRPRRHGRRGADRHGFPGHRGMRGHGMHDHGMHDHGMHDHGMRDHERHGHAGMPGGDHGCEHGHGLGHAHGHGFGPDARGGHGSREGHGHPMHHGRGFGGFDRGRGHDPRDGRGGFGEGRHGHDGPHRGGARSAARVALRAYERGFDAGYSRGRDA